MSSLKLYIGRTAGPYRDEVTQSRIAAFCKAIGVAESSVAPPTFLTVFRKGEFDLFQNLGLELANVLHAGQEFQYENSIQAGDHVHFETSVTNILEKQGSSGFMMFLTLETRFQGERNSKTYPIGKSETTIVVRERKG